MKKNLLLLLFGIIALVSLIFNFKSLQFINKLKWSTKTDFIKSKVTNVVDGDTFDVENGERVRLTLIDAPEFPKGCFSLESKNRLSELINGKTVKILGNKKDNFGRILTMVFLDNLNINKALVSEGYVQFSPQSTQTEYDVELKQAQDEAKNAKRGIWSSACQQKKEGCVIKGNYRADNKTKIYHLPNCYNYEKIVVNEKAGDRWFCNEIEAAQAGFLKSKDCL